MTEVSDRLY